MHKRKKDHMDICLKKQVESKTNGFERYRFIHNAMPEIDFDEIDTSAEFLGKKLGAPLIISPITGCKDYPNINSNLAKAAEKSGIAMSVGSERILVEDNGILPLFDVRKFCKNVPLIANLGAVQLNYGYGIRECRAAVELIGADALCLHLNPLQEALQIEGQRNFKGLFDKIKRINSELDCPLIVKEVGFGISNEVGERLKKTGIKYIDVSGSGGTNFACVENYRQNNGEDYTVFCDWGISTAESLALNKDLGAAIIASGGIRTGVDIAKAIVLGADLCGFALPLLKAATISAFEVEKVIKNIIDELKTAMFCIGVKDIDELKKSKALVKV